MNILTVADARKRYGTVPALDGATFELRKGELLALLGPNGAGKTTLIRAIAGRVKLDGGEIRVFDQPVVAGRTPKELGIVPQELALYPLLTARENLDGFGRLQGLVGSAAHKADRLGARTHRPGRSRARAREAVLGRHAPAVEHRLRHPAPPAHRAARRANRRRRPAEPRSDLRHARRAGGRGRLAAV